MYRSSRAGLSAVLASSRPYPFAGHVRQSWLNRFSTSRLSCRATETRPPPLSLLPMNMLLRSLLVAAISSHEGLLRFAFAVLSFLSIPRRALLDVERNPVFYWVLRKTFYDHFCAGENSGEVAMTIQRLKDMGFRGVILTYAKEIAIDSSTKQKAAQKTAIGDDPVSLEGQSGAGFNEDIEEWRQGVLKTVAMLGESDYLALKYTGAGAAVADALSAHEPIPAQMTQAIEEVCREAQRRGTGILVDAEQQFVQRGIDESAVSLMRKYNRGGKAVVYNTYQAYLKGTHDLLQRHIRQARDDGFTLGVKLVRGAYIGSEPRHTINDTKEDTDNSYDSITKALLSGTDRGFGNDMPSKPPNIEILLGTHNSESTLAAHQTQLARAEEGLPLTPVRYGQLLGMADEVSFTLIQLKKGISGPRFASPEVYKYLSWGTLRDCVSYLIRRAVENTDAVSRNKGEFTALRRELFRRFRVMVGLAR